MTRHLCFALLAMSVAGAGSIQAQRFHPRDYFVNNTAGIGKANTCTAQDPANPGTFNRVFQYSAGHCPGIDLFAWTKGAPNSVKWAEEHFFAEDGYIKLIDDSWSKDGYLDRSHALRDAETFRKGIPVFLDGWVRGYLMIDHPGFWVESWIGNTCPSTYAGAALLAGYEENVWVGSVDSWLFDCRAGRPCQGGPAYPVQVIRRSGNFGADTDHFWFARWQDPMAGGQWRGLGPVRFWCTGSGGACAPASDFRYLVDCEVSPTCYSCPDP